MKIAIVGGGYVGLVTGTCFAHMGNDVVCVDIDSKKIEDLKSGRVPIYEPNLEPLIKENLNKRLFFTTSLKEALNHSNIVFIAVGTPQADDGAANLEYVYGVAREIGQLMDKYTLIVDKSTVPVGTADAVRKIISSELDKRFKDSNSKPEFDVASNPEFLREGQAVEDFMRPDRIIIGSTNEKTIETLRELYRPFTMSHERFIVMDPRSAEMTKYASNAMLATRISFMNEIANICERVGANVNMVRIGVGSDRRIGYSFLYPGVGFGGSCFPKDLSALIKTSEETGYTPMILNSVVRVNKMQKYSLLVKAIKRFKKIEININDSEQIYPEIKNLLKGFTFAIWGLSFKPETDDMREAPSIVLIKSLLEAGAHIKAYDPAAMRNAKEYWLKGLEVEYKDNKYDTLNSADAMFLVTEWKEFRSPDFYEMKRRMRKHIIFDGRNQYNRTTLVNHGFEYYQIGVKQ